jgi:prepilin-type N-terminal cleavage/methylation domain-containing protein
MSPVMRGTLRRASGFTLAELLVAVVLLAIVGSTIVTMVVRQQRFYVGTSDIIETRGSVRQIADLLPTELRSLSPSSGDIVSMSTGAITFRSVRGATVICHLVSGTQIVVPPVNLSRQNGLTSWAATPVVGDSIMVFDVESNPRGWRRHRISGVSPGGQCLSALDFGATSAENAAGLLLTLDQGLPATIINGAPIRMYRQATYALYEASDAQWYLGYRDCLPFRVPACDAIQPVSGPYLPLGTAATSGLAMRYLDLAGNETAVPNDVVRIDVVARASSKRPVRRFEGAGEVYSDSIAFTIAVRN